MAGPVPAPGTSEPRVPRWWLVAGAAVSATTLAGVITRALGASTPALTSSRDLDWLFIVAALLVPAWRLWSHDRVGRILRLLAASRLRRVLAFLVLSLASLVSAVAVAFSLFLWRGQVAYSREHDQRRLPPGATEIRIAGLARLANTTPAEHVRMRTYFARNYRWMVTTWEGERVAFLRGGTPGARVHGSNGYQHTGLDSEGVQYRLGIYLDTSSQPPSRTPSDTVKAGEPSATVRLLYPPLAVVLYNSRLWIAGRMLGVEVFEEAARPERLVSNALVADLGEELRRVYGAAEISELDDLLEAGSMGAEPDESLSIEVGEHVGDDQDIGHGVYVVGGAVNPREEGHVSLRAFEVATNQPLEVTALPAPLEFVGWSADASRRYRYGFEVIVEDRKERDQVAARFELWFRPTAGGAPRRLGGIERVIRGYRY